MKLKLNHDNVSYVKSALRIIAGLILLKAGISWQLWELTAAGALITGAELLGILEELV